MSTPHIPHPAADGSASAPWDPRTRLGEPAAGAALPAEALLSLLHDGLVAYGASDDPALVAPLRRRCVDTFLDAERHFGYRHTGGAGPFLAVRGQLSVAEVAARLADRLYRLEAEEAPPKRFSQVLVCYRLEPRALPCERYVVQ